MSTITDVSTAEIGDGALELRVERYLNGELSRGETVAFEQELAQPRLGEAFREILLVRELLHSAPPQGVPDGLNERIIAALEIEMGSTGALDREESVLARQKRIARDGAAWMFRGPAMALAGRPPTPPKDAGSGGRLAGTGRRGAAAARATGGWLLRRMRSRG
jgi:hypothetical protein